MVNFMVVCVVVWMCVLKVVASRLVCCLIAIKQMHGVMMEMMINGPL